MSIDHCTYVYLISHRIITLVLLLNSIILLSAFLLQIHPCLLLAGDFNLLDISWSNGIDRVKPSPTFSNEVNQLLLDSVNDHDSDQLVNVPIYDTSHVILFSPTYT